MNIDIRDYFLKKENGLTDVTKVEVGEEKLPGFNVKLFEFDANIKDKKNLVQEDTFTKDELKKLREGVAIDLANSLERTQQEGQAYLKSIDQFTTDFGG